MKFRQRPQPDLDVNITPLIDIVFLLLIFFMVSTTFKQDFEVSIDLPKASSDERLVDKTLNIAIDPKGTYFVNNEKLESADVAGLKKALQKIAGGNRKLAVIIRADGQTPHQAVIRAMDAARQLGFSRLTFATQQDTE
ncbi:MAG TPA: biopolymer transporter ExbD [Gammaproteobacteria bacterium]|nr:biopolymer transporter ExbD [Gammaproteobacteria bacterium]